MKTDYQFLRFEFLRKVGMTNIWAMKSISSGDLLGVIKWYPRWRQYCLMIDFPRDLTSGPNVLLGIVLSAGCLRDIAEFIDQLMAERKSKGAMPLVDVLGNE